MLSTHPTNAAILHSIRPVGLHSIHPVGLLSPSSNPPCSPPTAARFSSPSIIDRAWKEGWITPRIPTQRSPFRVAVVGSGPAGLAAADQLNQAGHHVTVFERAPVAGGLLTYGIPNMKLDKKTVARRLDLLEEEGINFQCGVSVGPGGTDVAALREAYDSVVLATGATAPRDLPLPGRDKIKGIHFAMDFLTGTQTALFEGGDADPALFADDPDAAHPAVISARGKNVIVIGGGDTGTDCIGTSIRHGCKSMVNLELLGKPPAKRAGSNPWPEWPRVFNIDYGHGEAISHFGNDPRRFSVMSKEFIADDDGNLKALRIVQVEQKGDSFVEVPDSAEDIPADLVLLAMGFVSPEQKVIDQLGAATDARDNIYSEHGDFQVYSREDGTVLDGVFTAGDCRRGQSLVVWAINEGRGAAERVSAFLENKL